MALRLLARPLAQSGLGGVRSFASAPRLLASDSSQKGGSGSNTPSKPPASSATSTSSATSANSGNNVFGRQSRDRSSARTGSGSGGSMDFGMMLPDGTKLMPPGSRGGSNTTGGYNNSNNNSNSTGSSGGRSWRPSSNSSGGNGGSGGYNNNSSGGAGRSGRMSFGSRRADYGGRGRDGPAFGDSPASGGSSNNNNSGGGYGGFRERVTDLPARKYAAALAERKERVAAVKASILQQARVDIEDPQQLEAFQKELDQAEQEIKEAKPLPRRLISRVKDASQAWDGKYPMAPIGSVKTDKGLLQAEMIFSRRTVNMTRGGRRQSFSALLVVGDGNGRAGFALGKGKDIPSAMQKGILRAARHLVPIPRFEEHTIHHNIHVKYGRTLLYMRPAPQGHGLRCHKHIMSICQTAGIKNIAADVLQSTNSLNVVRAAFKALLSQRSVQSVAEARGKTVVEFRSLDEAPRIIASYPAPPTPNAIPSIQDNRAQVREWFKTFPREATPAHFLAARQLHELQQLILELSAPESRLRVQPSKKDAVLAGLKERARAAQAASPDLAKWLQTMPANAILLHTPLDIPYRENRLKLALA